MADLNKVMLIGRITNDLELKNMGDSGNKVLNFTLATNSSYKNQNGEKIETAEFHRCVAFGKTAEMMAQYLSKGRKIFVEGKLRTRQWEDQSGNKRYTTEVVVQNMNFCDSGNSGSAGGNTQTTSTSTSVSVNDEDEIPF